MATHDDFFRALGVAGSFEVVPERVTEEGGQLRALGRVLTDAASTKRWLRAMDIIHEVSERSSFSADTSKVYFRAAGRQLFAWRVIVQSSDLPRALAEITRALEAAAAPTPLEEYPLPGASHDRNTPFGTGRGATPVGSAVFPPVARASHRPG